MLVRVSIVAAFLAASTAMAPAATPHPVFWCDWKLDTSTAKVDAQGLAWRKLCNGDAEGARLILAPMKSAMEQRKGDGSYWVDYEKLYFYTLLATHHDAEAFHLLTDTGSNQPPWKPATAERHFFDGRYVDAFADLVADEHGFLAGDPGSQTPSPQLPVALADVRSGDLAGAIAEVKQVDEGSIYDLMLGNLYAQQRDWPHAFTYWMDQWNEEALEMMYYYRAHVPTTAPSKAP
jgi:hypothetical protein